MSEDTIKALQSEVAYLQRSFCGEREQTADLRAKLEAAEMERDAMRGAARMVQNSAFIGEDELRKERDQLREQSVALAAALEKERDRFDALRGFCESEMGWEYFRAEFMLGEKVSASQRNAEKLHKYLEANPRPAIDTAAILAEHDREVRRKALREARMKVEVLASELNRMAEEQE